MEISYEALSFRIEKMEENMVKMTADLYFGNGQHNPSITVRLDRLEQYAKETVANSKQTRAMMMTTMLSVLGALITAVVAAKMGWKI